MPKKIWLKIKSLVFFTNQNLTRCKLFKSKSDVFHFFYFWIWQVVNFFIQDLLFKSFLQILVELLPKCCQRQRTIWWIMTKAWGKKTLCDCVACACLMFGTIFLVIAFFMALGFLMGVMTISFLPPIDLYKSLWNSENGWFTKILF